MKKKEGLKQYLRKKRAKLIAATLPIYQEVNATEIIKQMCTDVTASNVEDRVALAISKWGLKEG